MIHAVGVGRGTVGGRREWWGEGICLGLGAHERPITAKPGLGLCVLYWLSLVAMWIHVNMCCLCRLSRSCMHPDHVNRPLISMLCQRADAAFPCILKGTSWKKATLPWVLLDSAVHTLLHGPCLFAPKP